VEDKTIGEAAYFFEIHEQCLFYAAIYGRGRNKEQFKKQGLRESHDLFSR